MTALQVFFGERDIRSGFGLIFGLVVVLAVLPGLPLVLMTTKGSLSNRFGWLLQKLLAGMLTLAALAMFVKKDPTGTESTLCLVFVGAALVLLAVIMKWAPKRVKGKQKGAARALKLLG